MGILRHKVLLLALTASVIAEGMCYGIMCMCIPNTDTPAFRLGLGFHRPAIAVMCICVPKLAEEQDVSIQPLENAAGFVVFFAVALLQWFVILLAGLGLCRHFFKRGQETIVAA